MTEKRIVFASRPVLPHASWWRLRQRLSAAAGTRGFYPAFAMGYDADADMRFLRSGDMVLCYKKLWDRAADIEAFWRLHRGQHVRFCAQCSKGPRWIFSRTKSWPTETIPTLEFDPAELTDAELWAKLCD